MSEFEHVPEQTQTKIGDGGKSISNEMAMQVSKEQFDELLPGVSTSVAKSVRKTSEAEEETAAAAAVRAVDFKLSLLSGMIDELWDDVRQLASTEPKLLATCMLAREPFARQVSTLQLTSAVINRLGTWVPDFARELRSIKEDKRTEDGDGDDEVDEYEDDEYEVDEYEEEKKAEEYHYAAYRRGRENRVSYGGNFEDTTVFSPMQFTHYMPGHTGQTPMGPKFSRTMQIYSIRVAETEGFPLEWPLEVYGVVAARDDVDHRRNLLFLRTRDDCQTLTKQDPFLHLTGPSRAIMSGDDVMIDVHLKLKGAVESKDRPLISKAFRYYDNHYGDTGISMRLLQGLCTLELCCEHLEHSLQATILSIQFAQGSLPCESGIKIVCFALPTEGSVPSRPVLLLDSQAGTMSVDEEGYLELSRRAVSVKLNGRLAILIQAREASGSVVFTPQSSIVNQERCDLGDCEVEITVAWSLIIESQHHIGLRGSVEPYAHELNPCTPQMKLEEDAC